MSPRLMILNGPNLDLLGTREPHIYGTTTLPTIEQRCRDVAALCGAKVALHQTNHEGVMIEHIHAACQSADAIIINPAGLSFTSIAILDALRIFEGPVIELHISNIHARDELHRHSVMSAAVTSVVCGLGPYGYVLAMLAALHRLGAVPPSLPGVLTAPFAA